MSIIEIKINVDVVAWYGAIIATSGIVLGILNYCRDRARIRVKKSESLFFDSYEVDDNTYISLEVINIGRRTVTISMAGFKLSNGYNFLIIRPKFVDFPYELYEGKSKSFCIAKNFVLDELNKKKLKIKYAWVKDATGKIYKCKCRIKK